jgi:putative ABC transport system permease protein
VTRHAGAGPRLARLLIAVAALIVGKRRRSDWRREWDAELWVASERGRPVVRDAFGAFHHALAVRRHTRSRTAAATARRFDSVRMSWLDVKLGLRMLTKYPGLSSVSVLGMAVAIAIGAGAFSMIESMTQTTLPISDGDRVVALRNAIITEPGRNQASLRDFLAWREELESVQDLAAFTRGQRTLVARGTEADLVRVVRMTASGFDIARTAPVLGRTLITEDERSDARVVVIGFEEWQRRFAADPHIIGRDIGLGSDVYTVVGVMPDGFGFPVADRYWIPLVIGPADRERADAIPVTIAGRLADGVTLERAQAELSAIGTRMAAAYPSTHQRLRPRVVHYTRAFFDMDSPAMLWTAHLFRLFLSLLLVVVAVNVAILVYARTATRVGEIAVRTALGASRARVVTQLFAEALVLSLISAVVGLAVAGTVLGKLQPVIERLERLELPFWMDLGLSTGVITYALALAIVAAVIAGVLPALKATGRSVQTNLQRLSGSGARLQLGRVWSALIIAQVAVAVAVLPFALHFAEEMIGNGVADPGYPVDDFLEASLAIEHADGPQDTTVAYRRMMEHRFATRAAELIGRLESDPAVAGVTVSISGSRERIEVEDQRRGASGTERIAPGFFALHEMPIVAGRAFVDGDARDGANAVIVNQIFVEDHLGSGTVLGRRVRFVREADVAGGVEPGPWLEIVGVVRDPESYAFEPSSRIYLPADVARLTSPVRLAIRVRADPAIGFAPRLRSIAAVVDPALQLDGPVSAAEHHRLSLRFARWFAIGSTAMLLSVLLLSAAGIYAMMSFTVARRRREIGIRSALGAAPGRLLASIFARASAQLSAGILFGLIGTFALDRLTRKGPVNDGNSVMLVLVAGMMITVGLLAAIGPARRGLAVQPTEALREE